MGVKAIDVTVCDSNGAANLGEANAEVDGTTSAARPDESPGVALSLSPGI